MFDAIIESIKTKRGDETIPIHQLNFITICYAHHEIMKVYEPHVYTTVRGKTKIIQMKYANSCVT